METIGKFSRYLHWENERKRTLTNLCMISVLLLFIGLPALSNSAEKVRVVEGLIQNVTDDSIEVMGRYYNIANVPLVDASGRNVSKHRLAKGKKVEIFFKGNKITSVLIHEYMVE